MCIHVEFVTNISHNFIILSDIFQLATDTSILLAWNLNFIADLVIVMVHRMCYAKVY